MRVGVRRWCPVPEGEKADFFHGGQGLMCRVLPYLARNSAWDRSLVPDLKFVSLRGTLVCDFGIKGTLAIYDFTCGFWI